jgi:large subunit ribosomal protein L10
MENPRPEKVAVVDEVRDKLRAADAALLTEYRGLKVGELADLRGALRKAGAEYRIYKNTLVRFAARDLGLLDLEELLEGPTAIAFVTGDAASTAKALRDFARTNPNLVVKGGLLGTTILDAKATGALADLPSREQLLAQLAGLLQAPLVKFAGLLQAMPRNFAYGLKALIDQKVAAGESAPESTTAEQPDTETAGDRAGAPSASGEAASDTAPEAASEPSADTDSETAGDGAGAPVATEEDGAGAPSGSGEAASEASGEAASEEE